MGRGESPDRRGRERSNSTRRTFSRSPIAPKREVLDYESPVRDRRFRDRSRSPRRNSRDRGGVGNSNRGRFQDGRDKAEPCPCLGVFGMSLHTTERDLKKIFGQYGDIESVQIVYDRFSGRSRGFGFVYFTSTRNATKAKDQMTDAVIDGMKVRVDYSVTRGGGPYRHQRSRSRSPKRPSNSGARVQKYSRSRSRS